MDMIADLQMLPFSAFRVDSLMWDMYLLLGMVPIVKTLVPRDKSCFVESLARSLAFMLILRKVRVKG